MAQPADLGLVELFLGPQSRLEGKLKTEGSVRCDGVFEGEMSVKGGVFVGKSGRANVNLIAKNVGLAGELRGQVMTDGLDWDRGAFFDGALQLTALSWEEF